MNQLQNFYLRQPEPNQSTLLALKSIILEQDSAISNELKYGMPFFCFKGKMFCYLWFHKKYQQPYIGFVEGQHLNETFLLQEKRSRMKIMLIDPNQDLPIEIIVALIQKAINLYKNGQIKIKL
jgi:hypothetical protein